MCLCVFVCECVRVCVCARVRVCVCVYRWGGRFSLLFESGPNRERSLALLLGFNPDKDYTSTVSQHMGGTRFQKSSI
jgi:hypothetical protein